MRIAGFHFRVKLLCPPAFQDGPSVPSRNVHRRPPLPARFRMPACLQERETTIDNKERRINELRLKSKELEKIKFVLDYKCAAARRSG